MQSAARSLQHWQMGMRWDPFYPRLNREIPPMWYEFPVYYKGNAYSLAAHLDDISILSYAKELDFDLWAGCCHRQRRKGYNRVNRLRIMCSAIPIYNDFSAREIHTREMTVGLARPKGKISSAVIRLGSGPERGKFLYPGDRVELEVKGIGILSNKIVAAGM